MRIYTLLALAAPLWAAMPAADQNALVKKYCAVCHTDASQNGGLSLEHFDAARRDPTLAAMMLSKLNSGAMGAAGNGVPSEPDQRAWLDSTKEQAAGAGEWFITRDANRITASIVREVPARKAGEVHLPVYRLRIACDSSSNKATHAGEMQLTWSPEPQTGRSINISVDGNAPVEYKIEGKERMGNGGTVESGRASIFLTKLPLAKQTLTIRDLFPGERVEFPIGTLNPADRAALQSCF